MYSDLLVSPPLNTFPSVSCSYRWLVHVHVNGSCGYCLHSTAREPRGRADANVTVTDGAIILKTKKQKKKTIFAVDHFPGQISVYLYFRLFYLNGCDWLCPIFEANHVCSFRHVVLIVPTSKVACIADMCIYVYLCEYIFAMSRRVMCVRWC